MPWPARHCCAATFAGRVPRRPQGWADQARGSCPLPERAAVTELANLLPATVQCRRGLASNLVAQVEIRSERITLDKVMV